MVNGSTVPLLLAWLQPYTTTCTVLAGNTAAVSSSHFPYCFIVVSPTWLPGICWSGWWAQKWKLSFFFFFFLFKPENCLYQNESKRCSHCNPTFVIPCDRAWMINIYSLFFFHRACTFRSYFQLPACYKALSCIQWSCDILIQSTWNTVPNVILISVFEINWVTEQNSRGLLAQLYLVQTPHLKAGWPEKLTLTFTSIAAFLDSNVFRSSRKMFEVFKRLLFYWSLHCCHC